MTNEAQEFAPRSWLFAPANDSRKVSKALASAADAVVLDLEDAVATAQKSAARTRVGEILAERPTKDVWVRVNGFETRLTELDLAAVCVPGLTGIIIPKVESAAGAQLGARLTTEAADRNGAAVALLAVIIESARGVLNAIEIADGHPNVRYLMFGAGDLSRDLLIEPSNSGPHILNGQIQTLLAARAAGVTPIDSSFFDISDTEKFETDCRVSKTLGFEGRGVIHPSQILGANAGYTPTEAEVHRAEEVLVAFENAERNGIAAIKVNGSLVDYAMIDQARRTLRRASGLAARATIGATQGAEQ